MNALKNSSAAVLSGLLLGGLLLAAPAARAQTAVSSAAPTVLGLVVPPVGEALVCSGPVKIGTAAVADPVRPGVLVTVDATGLSCTGLVTGAPYVNTGQARLTRALVAGDIVRTTFAVYPAAAGGALAARTALLTLGLSYDTTTGALLGASAAVSAF